MVGSAKLERLRRRRIRSTRTRHPNPSK
jgi:hypothetical protein